MGGECESKTPTTVKNLWGTMRGGEKLATRKSVEQERSGCAPWPMARAGRRILVFLVLGFLIF